MQRKTFYTKKLGRAVSSSAGQVIEGRYHIISGSDKRWKVIADGNVRPTKVFTNQEGAIRFARSAASRLKGEVVVHTPTGEIRKIISAA